MFSSWFSYAIDSPSSSSFTYSLIVCKATSFPSTARFRRHGFYLFIDQDFSYHRFHGVDCSDLCSILEEFGIFGFPQHCIALYGSVTCLSLSGQFRRSIYFMLWFCMFCIDTIICTWCKVTLFSSIFSLLCFPIVYKGYYSMITQTIVTE